MISSLRASEGVNDFWLFHLLAEKKLNGYTGWKSWRTTTLANLTQHETGYRAPNLTWVRAPSREGGNTGNTQAASAQMRFC